jgi:hypothetical protein
VRYFTEGILPKYTVFLWFWVFFQTYFWNLSSTSGLSQIYKMRNVWKLPIPFSRNTVISSIEKTSLSWKTLLWKENCPVNSKLVMKIFCHVRIPCKSHVFRISQSHYLGNPYTCKIFMTIFEFFGQFFFQNDVFKLQEDFSELGIRVLANGLGSFQTFLILQIWDKPEMLERFQKQFWKLDLKSKKPRILWFP